MDYLTIQPDICRKKTLSVPEDSFRTVFVSICENHRTDNRGKGECTALSCMQSKSRWKKNPAGFAGTKKYGGKRKDKDEDSIRAGGVPGQDSAFTHSKTSKIK